MASPFIPSTVNPSRTDYRSRPQPQRFHQRLIPDILLSFSVLCTAVYDPENETLEEGETVEDRFVRIQAAYELLSDLDQRQEYDMQNRTNPMKVCANFTLEGLYDDGLKLEFCEHLALKLRL